MSVKRLTYLNDLLKYTTKRLDDLKRHWSHAEEKSFKDILQHADLAELMAKELLARAKKYQKRDMEKRATK